MKSITTLSLFILIALCASAQTPEKYVAADKNAVLNMNGKTFHSGDVIKKESFQNLITNHLQVGANSAERPFNVVSFQCVISLKDSNGVWKFDTKLQDHSGYFNEILTKTKSKDLIFIDDLKYSGTIPANFPTQFNFTVE